jgi:hypothetical protein
MFEGGRRLEREWGKSMCGAVQKGGNDCGGV